MNRTHELKTWPSYYEEVRAGRKPFEFRFNDRDFAVGDTLELREWDPAERRYTFRKLRATVTYVLHGGTFVGLAQGWCVMGLGSVEEVASLEPTP